MSVGERAGEVFQTDTAISSGKVLNLKGGGDKAWEDARQNGRLIYYTGKVGSFPETTNYFHKKYHFPAMSSFSVSCMGNSDQDFPEKGIGHIFCRVCAMSFFINFAGDRQDENMNVHLHFASMTRRLALVWLVGMLISGCGIYTLSGGVLKPGLETVSIELFENNANLVVPTLAQDLTEGLKDRFISQSNLRLVTYDGDMVFSGAINSYTVSPVNIQGNETAAQNRLTIGVKVDYENTKYPEDSWTQNFSQFADFNSSQTLTDVEASLIEDIIDRLTTDIFNKVLSNW